MLLFPLIHIQLDVLKLLLFLVKDVALFPCEPIQDVFLFQLNLIQVLLRVLSFSIPHEFKLLWIISPFLLILFEFLFRIPFFWVLALFLIIQVSFLFLKLLDDNELLTLVFIFPFLYVILKLFFLFQFFQS